MRMGSLLLFIKWRLLLGVFAGGALMEFLMAPGG